jgi:methionine aminotransferase
MSKLPHVGTTIFTVMSQLAAENNAINLSQGFPNFPIDERLRTILKEVAGGEFHQYMPMGGYPKLLGAICSSIIGSYGRDISPSEVLVTAGATQAIFTAITALIEKDEEVIILDPSYDCYEPAITLTGGIPVRVQLKENFLPDWQAIEDKMSSKTKMLIINNPHNPSGRVWSEQDMSTLRGLLAKHPQVILLSDEVYEYITFEQKHISINQFEELKDRSIITSSFGKTFHVTGWKLGYLVASDDLMKEIKKVHQFNVFCVNSVAQASIAEYLGQVNLQELGGFYQQKRDLFRSLMSESRFKLMPCEGTYFQIADYSEISDLGDVEFCKELTTKHGVAAIPVSVFNGSGEDNKMIRFCFAKDDQTLIDASKKLCRI